MSEADVLPVIAEIVHRVAGVPRVAVSPERRLTEDLRLDSLSMVEVLTATEAHFGIRIEDADAPALVTVADLERYVVRRRG